MSHFLKRLKEAITHPRKIFQYILGFKIFYFMPDKMFVSLQYRAALGKKLNIENPVTLNEKMQWLKLYDRKPIYHMYSDKYAVREFVASRVGEKYLVPVYGVWDSADEVDFSVLPNKFVLKPTHASGNIYICRDKSKLDEVKIRNEMRKWLKRDYYPINREWYYKDIKPRIIAEKMLVEDITDYKFFCFNGKPALMYLSHGLENHKTTEINFFDLDYNLLPFKRNDFSEFSYKVEKPENSDEMLDVAKKLADVAPFIRVDLYNIDGHIYFSELTFCTCSGCIPLSPKEYDKVLGDMLKIDTSGK